MYIWYSFMLFLTPIASYVLFGLAYYKLGKRRNIKGSFLAWIPLVKIYLIGKVQDDINADYNKTTHRGILLLALHLLAFLLIIPIMVYSATHIDPYLLTHMNTDEVARYLLAIFTPKFLASSFLLLFVSGALFAVTLVLSYVSFYRTFKEYSPDKAVLYLVICIIAPVVFDFLFFPSIFVLSLYDKPAQFETLNHKSAFSSETSE